MLDYSVFPAINASLNGTTTVLLRTGYVLIRPAASPRTGHV